VKVEVGIIVCSESLVEMGWREESGSWKTTTAKERYFPIWEHSVSYFFGSTGA
jgi:hypothetical protein